MMKNLVSEYVRTMFRESRDGEVMVGDADQRYGCPVDWDEQTAESLAEQCGTLVAHLTELAGQYDKLKTETRHLTKEQMDVWTTYLRPFPEHGLDMDALQAIWEKFETDAPVTEEEYALADQYILWFEENALSRSPVKCCAPIRLMSRAKRYGKLIRLGAPDIVRESEAKRFAEEFVLYHCMKQ